MNRKLVASITVMFLLSPVLLSLGAKAQYSWPMFHNNPSHTGYTSGPGPTTNQTLWIYETLYDIWGPCPVVVNGMLYIGGGWGPILYALNATTGGSMWNYTTWAWIASTPSVVDNVVYFSSYNTNVTALDASTGALIWNYTTGGFLAASSPCVVNDVLYIGGGWGNIVYALNATAGLQIWNYTTEDQVHSSPAVADGIIYVGSSDDNVYALNATTGAKIWNYTTGGSVTSSPAVVDGVVYVGSYDNNTYALNATTGAKIWNFDTGGAVSSSPAVANDVIYVGTGIPANKTYALNAFTGEMIWSYKTGGDVWASPAVADGAVYVASRDGKIYAFVGSRQTFNATWELQTYPVTVLSNSSLSDFEFNQPNMQISFNVTGPKAMSSFCNVTIPKSLLKGTWTVEIDQSDIVPTIDENDIHTFLYFTYTHTSTHHIVVTGSWVVPEFPTGIVASLLLITTLLATLLGKMFWSKKPKGLVAGEQKEAF